MGVETGVCQEVILCAPVVDAVFFFFPFYSRGFDLLDFGRIDWRLFVSCWLEVPRVDMDRVSGILHTRKGDVLVLRCIVYSTNHRLHNARCSK